MNITLVRLKGVVKELAGIRAQLTRLADCWEIELAQQGVYVKPPAVNPSDPDPTVTYNDEEMGWAKEQDDFIRKLDERVLDERVEE